MQTTVDIRELQERIERESSFVDALTLGMNQVIVGQKHLVESLLIGLLADGHILLEGVPGLAKTLAIKTLAQLVKADFSRIQFTPDLLPADVLGTQIYSQKTEEFRIKKGPIFANFVLADEINRAPAKVQSALLEAMQERQITIGEQTFYLDEPFLVLATQNPIEQEGTYPLPEAQTDRFMLKVVIDYPKKEEEQLIIRNNLAKNFPKPNTRMYSTDVKPQFIYLSSSDFFSSSCVSEPVFSPSPFPLSLSSSPSDFVSSVCWFSSSCLFVFLPPFFLPASCFSSSDFSASSLYGFCPSS